MRRMVITTVAIIFAFTALMTLAGCDPRSIIGGTGVDNTAQFKVTYHGNPVEGAYVYIAELDAWLQTNNQGMTGIAYTGTLRHITGSYSYGSISNLYGRDVQVGANQFELGF